MPEKNVYFEVIAVHIRYRPLHIHVTVIVKVAKIKSTIRVMVDHFRSKRV